MAHDHDHCTACGLDLPSCWPLLCPACVLRLPAVPLTDWPALEPPC